MIFHDTRKKVIIQTRGRQDGTPEKGSASIHYNPKLCKKELKKLLEHCIKHNHPQLAYKGKDKLKLFNFYTMDKKTREHTDGYKTWDRQSGRASH